MSVCVWTNEQVRCLLAEYGSYDNMPLTIQAPLLEVRWPDVPSPLQSTSPTVSHPTRSPTGECSSLVRLRVALWHHSQRSRVGTVDGR